MRNSDFYVAEAVSLLIISALVVLAAYEFVGAA